MPLVGLFLRFNGLCRNGGGVSAVNTAVAVQHLGKNFFLVNAYGVIFAVFTKEKQGAERCL